MRISSTMLCLAFGVAVLPGVAHAQLLTGRGPVAAPDAYSAGQRLASLSGDVQEVSGYSPVMTAPETYVSSDGASGGAFLTRGSGAYPVQHDAGAEQAGSPVDLQANSMSHDDVNNIVSAQGDVMVVQEGRILRADEMRYAVDRDTFNARGNVVLNEESGHIHLSDTVTYNNRLRDGTVTNLRSFLSDGSRARAVRGERIGGTKTVMHDAFYTPCEPCKANPENPPVWDIVASEVTHDEAEKRISYRHARMEFFGVPVAYTPYFSHPDGTVKQKSGFLTPSGGFKSSLGTFAEGKYYWAIAPDQDMTAGLRVMTEEDPLLTAEYRKRWANAEMEVSGGVTNSGRKDRTGGVTVEESDELRGHVFAEGLWDMNDQWRSGLNVNWTSDDQYMRQYDFTDDDVLTNEVYAERFSGRDYASVRMMTFHDIRLTERAQDQPDVLPEAVASFVGDPGGVPLIKGQWSAEASMLGLMRGGSGQDVNRFGLELGWDRRMVSDYGFLTSVEARARGDFYHVNDRASAAAGSGESTNGFESRYFPNLHVKTSYPMARPFETMQARIEPVAALTLAPNISSTNRIPNEDSVDAQIDASNLFEASRFPGIDRVEDQSRVTYGMRGGLYGYQGSFGEVFLGQSYRLAKDDNPFSAGSGLDRRSSDYVGQVSGRYGEIYNLDYRFQLASQDISSQRHEVDAWADWNRFRVHGTYLYASGLEGSGVEDSREQAGADAQFYFSRDWRARFGGKYDLGVDDGFRKAHAGLDYLGQCLFVSLVGEKSFTTEASGDGGTEILFRIGLRNMGDFEESQYREESEIQMP